MIRTDLIIVGAGPAGLAAADVLSPYDIDLIIVDEQARSGGQIYRQPPESFKVSRWLSSRIYKSGKQLISKVSQMENIQWLTQTRVLGITQNNNNASDYRHKVAICKQNGAEDIEAKCVLIASGCHDMPVIFPGWNTPGVMATGGIQAFVKSQQLIPGERFLFVGTHPLQLIVADQILQAGGSVAGVIFAQSFSRVLALLKSPAVLLRNTENFFYIAVTLFRLLKAGVPVSFNETVIGVNGDEELDSAIIASVNRIGNINKETARKVDCDRLGVCFSFLTSSELARQCGSEYSWSNEGGGWIIKHDKWMCTNISNIYVAGEITGVAGAEVAKEEGRLAGIGIALSLGKLDPEHALHLAKSIRKRLHYLNQFADALKSLSYPGNNLLEQLMTEESILCKCEEITVREFLNELEKNPHISNANAAKLLSRAGMGLCQGRYCQYHIIQILARHASASENDIGPFTAQFPSKPVKISELIE